ncbi:MAG TPA: hypothetical protein PLZ38_08390 [Spirochaetota bacterium]|nr:hypothetical protein [Spirochaetota bacterium]HPK45983.1 hypothetical protein [Spirochaetota bacterium]
MRNENSKHYTTSLSRQARKPVVYPPWNGYMGGNEGTPPYEVVQQGL